MTWFYQTSHFRLVYWQKKAESFNRSVTRWQSKVMLIAVHAPHGPHHELRTPNVRHKSKEYENLGWCRRQNMLQPYLKIWDWELIFSCAVKAISSPGVCSPWYFVNNKHTVCNIQNYFVHQSHLFFFPGNPCKIDVYQVKIILNCPISHHSALHCNLEAPCSSSSTLLSPLLRLRNSRQMS